VGCLQHRLASADTTEGNIDYIKFYRSFNDPLGYMGSSYEGVVQNQDFDMSKKMEVVSQDAHNGLKIILL
jgi:dipeptidyl-peptidase-3